jgi:hypothetical protein
LSAALSFEAKFYVCEGCTPTQVVASFKKNKHWYDNDYSSDGYWLLPSASDIGFFARYADASAIGAVGSLVGLRFGFFFVGYK